MSSGENSHAEGILTLASGFASHAEGRLTTASGFVSHAEGYLTVARHSGASTQGFGSSDDTPSELAIGGLYGLDIFDAMTLAFDAVIVARMANGTSACFRRTGLLGRTAGTVALVGSVQTVGTDNNVPGWSVSIIADDTNKALKLSATGAAATTIHWVARIELVEVGF